MKKWMKVATAVIGSIVFVVVMKKITEPLPLPEPADVITLEPTTVTVEANGAE